MNARSKNHTDTNTLQGLHLGAPPVYEDYYEFDQSILVPKCHAMRDLCPKFMTKYQDHLEVGDAGSTAANELDANDPEFETKYYRQPHMWPELRDFIAWLEPRVHRILADQWEFKYEFLMVTNSWVNRHGRGGWTNWHNHGNTDLNIAAYITAPENSGDLIMADPLELHWMGYSQFKRTRDTAWNGYKLPARTNAVYFFPSWMRHRTEASKTDEERWVLSINFKAIPHRPDIAGNLIA